MQSLPSLIIHESEKKDVFQSIYRLNSKYLHKISAGWRAEGTTGLDGPKGEALPTGEALVSTY